MTGAHDAIEFAKYAHRTLADVQCRFNRQYELRAILPSLMHAMAVTPAIDEAGIRVC